MKGGWRRVEGKAECTAQLGALSWGEAVDGLGHGFGPLARTAPLTARAVHDAARPMHLPFLPRGNHHHARTQLQLACDGDQGS